MSNHIDLTLDDFQDTDTNSDAVRYAKRPRTDISPWAYSPSTTPQPLSSAPAMLMPLHANPPLPSTSMSQGPQRFGFRPPYRPFFAHPNSFHSPTIHPPTSSTSSGHSPNQQQPPTQHLPSPQPSERDIIDLTSSPSPPPRFLPGPLSLPQLPPELSPKTPVCIGQFSATALILYPDQCPATQNLADPEWCPVKLQYEHDAKKIVGKDTIHIKASPVRKINGECVAGDRFGMIEQRVADSIGPMLARGLIRLESKIRKGSSAPFLPLQVLVYTPKGNIHVVGKYLRECNILLNHPSNPFDPQKLHYHYCNPHDSPPEEPNRTGGAMISQASWQTPSAKSVEVQRGQIDELFKNLKDGDGLSETEPCFEIATTLYPHQKKALTFLLDREKVQEASPDGFSSLWQKRVHQLTGRTLWLNVITQKEVYESPIESKGAILADDMGLGKTITCVSLIGATLDDSIAFAASPLDNVAPPTLAEQLEPDHFAGSVWGMPDTSQSSSRPPTSAKARAKAERLFDKHEAEYARLCRIKVKSRATLIICPLSTVTNWEEQFRDHWNGGVVVTGGSGIVCGGSSSQSNGSIVSEPEGQVTSATAGRILRIYVYHGNTRRPDPSFLSDFDAVITTYTTLATEFSKQTKSLIPDDDGDGDRNSDDIELDEGVDPPNRSSKPKMNGKRKKPSTCNQANNPAEISSALQSVHWFRVVLDEAHYIKEPGTVACRACCDLMADRRLCLTGTPVQNKLDDIYALVKFLRIHPFDDKPVWTEYIGGPVKFGQVLGVARLQTIMKCITLRRTKGAKSADGSMILSLPPRRDELRLLKFESREQEVYDKFFKESKDEFTDLSKKNEVMKNYVGILQKILRLRQICDHFELVDGKEAKRRNESGECSGSFEDITAAIETSGFDYSRAAAVFALLCDSTTAQCVECGNELGIPSELSDVCESEMQPPLKRGRKSKATSRSSTRASSPDIPRPVLTRCLHLFCLVCYRNSVCPGWPKVSPDIMRACSTCQAALSPMDAFEINYASLENCPKKKEWKRERRPKEQCLQNFVASTKIKSLLQDLTQFSSINPHSSNYVSDFEMTDKSGMKIEPDVVKSVVFSQWTSMLDKVEDALQLAGIRYGRLDGTMKRDERIRAMNYLKQDPACEVLLVSLKAGGVGLNLTAAQRVYLLDPYWNPAVENQAVDRIHRLGQTRPVTTIKLIIENSIEARLLEVQQKKTALANMTLKSVSKADILSRRVEELAELFKS